MQIKKACLLGLAGLLFTMGALGAQRVATFKAEAMRPRPPRSSNRS
ncbi:MAG: hypothetical protein ACP5RC_12000 [Halothiobacillaceae bacterium]